MAVKRVPTPSRDGHSGLRMGPSPRLASPAASRRRAFLSPPAAAQKARPVTLAVCDGELPAEFSQAGCELCLPLRLCVDLASSSCALQRCHAGEPSRYSSMSAGMPLAAASALTKPEDVRASDRRVLVVWRRYLLDQVVEPRAFVREE